MGKDAFAGLESLLARGRERQQADAERLASLDDDACQLCEAHGEDKRSLFISCFYVIHEVVPEAIDLSGAHEESMRGRGYYLRICKACRGSFLGHLRAWREERIARRGLPMDHDGNDEPTNAERNIPLRENGALVWLTRAEWDAREAAK